MDSFRRDVQEMCRNAPTELPRQIDGSTPLDHFEARIYLIELNNLAWECATSSDASSRDPERAMRLAQPLITAAPQEGNYWNTLGAAHYRAGSWQQAVRSLQKSMALRAGGDSFDWFFLAMCHWQLGQRDQARDWYTRAVEWMTKYKPQDAELIRFRSEAAELLGMPTG